MSTSKRLRAPLIALSGVIMAVVTFAGPANAADPVYPPAAGGEVLGSTQVLGSTATSTVPEASPATGELAFTGANALGVSALGGLLLVGGATMVLVGKRRKVNS
ncbi:MAG TPA: hypothetical protein VIJ15_03720 [Dermatophilaceae bacterium]